MHFNIQGLKNKCDMLNIHLSTHDVDLLCITEHWLRETELDHTVIENYKLVSHYSRSNLQRGGVCIFAKKKIDIIPQKTNHSCEKHFEMSVGVINSQMGEKIYLIVIYRTPDGDFNEFIHRLEMLFHQIYNKRYQYIICGDININFFVNSTYKQSLQNFFASYNIVHHINMATRISQFSSTCIDNIFSNCRVNNVQVNNSYLSDHTYQICKFIINIKEEQNTKHVFKRNFNQNNIQTFINLISRESWEGMYMSEDFQDKFDAFYQTFCHHYNCAFPITKARTKTTTKKWFTPEIKAMHNQLCEMEKLEKQLRNPNYTARYKEFKSLYKQKIHNYRTNINSDRLAQANNIMRESWKIINETRNPNITNSFIKLKSTNNDKMITDVTEIANKFSEFFSNVNESCPKPKKENVNITNQEHNLFLIPTTPIEINNIIIKTTLKPAAGIDDIHGKILRSVSAYIKHPLSYLINASFSTGSFPQSLKESKCIPIYKNKGSRFEVINYRSIHLQCQFSKIFESAYCIRLNSFLDKFKILSQAQHGFRGGKSTTTAIFECLHSIYDSLNKKEHIVALFYDLSRAFDTVDHQLLLDKLYGIGIRGVAHQWVTDYLNNRTQTVSIQGTKSHTTKNTLGVPQGSILAPTLFILFTNDINKTCINSDKVILYADDTNLLVRQKTIETLVQKCNTTSIELSRWCSDNGLILNKNKTFYMQFLTKPMSSDYSLLIKTCHQSTQSIDNIKFLGLFFDPKLTWEVHINSVCSKLSEVCYIIIYMKNTVSEAILKTLYYGLVQSTLQYGLIFWGSSAHINKAFIVQKKILRCMAGISPLATCKPLFKKFKILTLPCLYIFQLIMHIHTNRNHFTKNNEMHLYNTRNCHMIHQPFARLNISQNDPTYIGIKCYNKVKFFETTDTTNTCKNKLNTFLLEHAFYSMDEFLNHQS